jgi:hypothetical protein
VLLPIKLKEENVWIRAGRRPHTAGPFRFHAEEDSTRHSSENEYNQEYPAHFSKRFI